MGMGGQAQGGSRPRGALLRRFVHIAGALTLVYYLIPVELPFFGLRRWVLLIAFFAIVASIEYLRLRRRTLLYGLRPHEKNSVASFVWFAAGATLVMWCFPHDVASVAIIGMALVDPLMGELRARRSPGPVKIGLPLASYALIGLIVFDLSGHWTLLQTGVLALGGALVAIPSEWYKVAYIDDDFLMMTVPAIVMAWLSLAF